MRYIAYINILILLLIILFKVTDLFREVLFMEYNTMLYKVFKWVKASNTWRFVMTFRSYSEASHFCNKHGGAYQIVEEQSHD